MAHTNLPRSGVLVLGSNGIQSLLPATLTSQIESLLGSHRLADAADLAEQQRKKLQALPRVDEDEVRSHSLWKSMSLSTSIAGRTSIRVSADWLSVSPGNPVRGRR